MADQNWLCHLTFLIGIVAVVIFVIVIEAFYLSINLGSAKELHSKLTTGGNSNQAKTIKPTHMLWTWKYALRGIAILGSIVPLNPI